MNEYPKWLFHRDLPARIVQNPDQHEALGDGWEETPAAFDAPAEELQSGYELVPDIEAPAQTRAQRRAAAKAAR